MAPAYNSSTREVEAKGSPVNWRPASFESRFLEVDTGHCLVPQQAAGRALHALQQGPLCCVRTGRTQAQKSPALPAVALGRPALLAAAPTKEQTPEDQAGSMGDLVTWNGA